MIFLVYKLLRSINKSNKKKMATQGTFGTNTDNFNITGNTNITNLTVSGTASFPINSIDSTCISGDDSYVAVQNTLFSGVSDDSYYLPFLKYASTNTTSGQILYTDSGLSYNPISNHLQCTLITTSLTGTATNTTRINTYTTDNINNTIYYPLLVPLSTASTSQIPYSDSGLSYNSTTDTLIVTNVVGNSTTATTATNITPLSYNSGTLSYLTFVNSTTSQQLKIDDVTGPLSYTPSSGVLNCGGLTLTGQIKLPTTATGYTASAYATGTFGTGAGNIGCIVSGSLLSSFASGFTQASPLTLSSIILPIGVWIINSSMVPTMVNGGYMHLSISPNNSWNRNVTSFCYTRVLNIINLNTCVSITSETTYKLFAYCNSSAASALVGNFTAVRIA
jgi:hypothetical protein